MSTELWVAVIGGVCSVIGAFVAAIGGVRYGFRRLEETEIRRHKVDCIIALYGLRYVMGSLASATDNEQAQFMFQLNRVGALYGDKDQVQRRLRDYQSKKGVREFLELLRAMAEDTQINLEKICDSDIESVFVKAPTAPLTITSLSLGSTAVELSEPARTSQR